MWVSCPRIDNEMYMGQIGFSPTLCVGDGRLVWERRVWTCREYLKEHFVN